MSFKTLFIAFLLRALTVLEWVPLAIASVDALQSQTMSNVIIEMFLSVDDHKMAGFFINIGTLV